MSDKSLFKQLERIKEELARPLPAHHREESEMGAKKAKKVVKKVVKKVSAKKEGGDLVHLADLAKEAKISPQRARQKLRAAEGIERDGRWKWEKDSSQLKKVRKALDLE